MALEQSEDAAGTRAGEARDEEGVVAAAGRESRPESGGLRGGRGHRDEAVDLLAAEQDQNHLILSFHRDEPEGLFLPQAARQPAP